MGSDGPDPCDITDAKRRYRGWNGKRSRFILTCALCGNRYQGFHRSKGKKRMDGTRAKSFGYGCGGYITKGTSVCQMNSIPQEVLEKTVIDAVLDFYKPYLQPEVSGS